MNFDYKKIIIFESSFFLQIWPSYGTSPCPMSFKILSLSGPIQTYTPYSINVCYCVMYKKETLYTDTSNKNYASLKKFQK